MKKTIFATLIVSCALVLAPKSANAQILSPTETAELAAKYFENLRANINTLKNYSWQYRTEVWENDQLQWVDLMNANLDSQGLPVFTQINREQMTPKKHGMFSKPKQNKRFEQLDAIISYVSDWNTWYNRMPLSRITELFDQASRSGTVASASADGSLIRVDGKNIRESNANDSVSIWLHKDSAVPVQFTFVVPVQKSLDGAVGETINAKIAYRFLRNGEAFYADHIEILVPSRNLRIKVENLNMQAKL